MKRYSMKAYQSDGVFCKSYEDGWGAWVKWEDVKHLRPTDGYEQLRDELVDALAINETLNNEIRRLKVTTITAKDGTLKVRDVTECNCHKMLFHECHDGRSIVSDWVCPKHGYKKR